MTFEQNFSEEIPLFISRSNTTTEANKTGTWRFVRPIYDEKTAPCSVACPAGEDIARIEMLISQGKLKEAFETILLENPFPAVCGRVCFHPCETVCNRANFDDPVGINRIERFIGDTAIKNEWNLSPPRLPENGKRVCIVGAGPSGMSAGYFLAQLGYSCDIFEAESEPGGILRWGIPKYRLPASVLNSEIERIKQLGVNIYCNLTVTEKFLEEAKNRYHAVFIGCGHGRSLKMNIPGEDMAFDGLEFLNRMQKGESASFNGTAAIIGGGNTAIDVSRSLVRLGVKPILVYRRRKQDMPAFEIEVDTALEEGVTILELFSPLRIEPDANEYVLTLQRMKTTGMETEKGRARVVPDGETTQHLRVQSVFTAIGAEPLKPWHLPSDESTDTLKLSHCRLTVENPLLLFGGDLTNSVKSVTDAVASGKQAAMAIDTFLQKGMNALEDRIKSCAVGNGPSLSMESYMGGTRSARNVHIVSYDEINLDYFLSAGRISVPSLSVDDRIQSFSEIERTLTDEQVLEEIRRCFNCGICNSCDNCRIFCPELAVIFKDTRRSVDLDYCKGCGICVVECPRNAMVLEEEK